jgi:hypothetical protein
MTTAEGGVQPPTTVRGEGDQIAALSALGVDDAQLLAAPQPKRGAAGRRNDSLLSHRFPRSLAWPWEGRLFPLPG